MIINHYLIFPHLPCEVRAVLVSLMYVVWLELELVNVELVETLFVISSPPENLRFRQMMSAHFRNSFMDIKNLIMNHLRFLFSQPHKIA